MILTCPGCAARFMIDDRALGSTGRTVRCGACGHSWHQFPQPAVPPSEPAFAPVPEPGAAPARSDAAVAAVAGTAAVAEKEAEPKKERRRWRRRAEAAPEIAAAAVAGAAELTARDVAASADAEGARGRRGASRVLVWFLFVFIVAAIVLGGYRYRQDVVRLWPPATRLYQVLGIGVDPPSGYWLRVPEDSIKFRREAEGGIPILVVSGEILNQSDKPQRVAPMRILLLDKENRVLRTERVKIDDRTLDPGKRLPFQTSIPNSPPEAVAVRITFDVSG